MSSGTIVGIGTALLLIGFIGFVLWVYSPWQKRRWEESSRLPLEDDDNEDGTKGGAPDA